MKRTVASYSLLEFFNIPLATFTNYAKYNYTIARESIVSRCLYQYVQPRSGCFVSYTKVVELCAWKTKMAALEFYFYSCAVINSNTKGMRQNVANSMHSCRFK